MSEKASRSYDKWVIESLKGDDNAQAEYVQLRLRTTKAFPKPLWSLFAMWLKPVDLKISLMKQISTVKLFTRHYLKMSSPNKVSKKTKKTARMAKTTKAGNDTPAQLKADLNYTANNPLITPSVLRAISKTVNAIDRVLIGERRIAVNLGCLLAERKDLHRLGLPTSVLIEFSRLEPEPLKQFLKKHPTAELKKLPIVEIKKLVRGVNPKKRASRGCGISSSESVVNVKMIAEKTKSNFDKVRTEFDGDSALEKSLDSVLGEISKWYLDKKVA